MKTAEIITTRKYRNYDDRLGAPGVYTGKEIFAQLAIFGREYARIDNPEDYNLEEIPLRCRYCGAYLVKGKCPVDRRACRQSAPSLT